MRYIGHMLFDGPLLQRGPTQLFPGVVHLPSFLDEEEQRALVEQARELARSVAGTPVAMRRPLVGNGQMKVWLLSLGWFWETKPYRLVQQVQGVPVPPVPENYQGIADRVMAAASEVDQTVGPTPRIETALVNFYPPGTGMGLHVDAEEQSEAAVVSLSMGEETVFRIEGPGGHHDVLLMSGDAIVFGGPARRAKHGVLGAQPGTRPEHTGLKEGRINITMRQVHP